MTVDSLTHPVENSTTDFGPWLAQASILVVDDEPGMRHFLTRTLTSRCKQVEAAEDTTEASKKLDQQYFDIVIIDNILPGKTGVEWLREQRDIGCFGSAILITAYADLDTAIQALRAGAVDFVLKPFRSNQILNAVARCLKSKRLQQENFILRQELRVASENSQQDRLTGNSAVICNIRSTLTRVAPLPTSVLITGQSGTGKEIAARSIHALSDRADKPFVPVNCAAIPHDMIEAELFGHLKGAFSGAHAARDGLFAHAQGGSLFLDELGEMPAATQSKLLRALESRRIRPLGSSREIPVDVRFIFATNADLQRDVDEGRFRADLYYRINVMQIHMPPLSDRREDIAELLQLFMDRLSRQLGISPVALNGATLANLEQYAWPGNVRELRNMVERALILGQFPDSVMASEAPTNEEPSNKTSLAAIERQHITKVLQSVDGNRAEAARQLGIARKTIDRKLTTWAQED